MEYRKDKRTMNLTLRSIHVGDWVQVWSEYAERYSPPLKITQICDDGTIYLIGSDEERLMPWEENIKNVDALPVTPELLKGFGFELNDYRKNIYNVYYNGDYMCELKKEVRDYTLRNPWKFFGYFHEFIDVMYYYFPELLNLEWKGSEK